MNFIELKETVQSIVWNTIHKNGWKESDNFSIVLSEQIARKINAPKSTLNITKLLTKIQTNFFKINNVTKEQFVRELSEELVPIRTQSKLKRGKTKTASKIKNYEEIQRKDFSEEDKNQVLRNQDHRCANPQCRRLLNVVHYDHIDGIRSNNHISNCQALCPNCHEIKTHGKATF